MTAADAGFLSVPLIIAALLNLVLQAIQIGAYAARVAGVQTGRIGTSISLFNLFVTASRFANMFYAPLLGTLSDHTADALRLHRDSDALLRTFEWQMRTIVFAGTIGTALGALLLPTFIYLFVRGVGAFERRGSMPRALARLLDPRVLLDVARTVRLPSPRELMRFDIREVPPKLLIGNTIVTGIYAIGVVAAILASVLRPDVARTAISASGLVNGIATISFALIVDPTSAFIVDQAAKGERPVSHVKAMVVYLSATAVAGTLLAQFLLGPRRSSSAIWRISSTSPRGRPLISRVREDRSVKIVRFAIIVIGALTLAGCTGSIANAIAATRVHQGELAYENGHFAEAALAYKLALDLEPGDARGRTGLAAVQLRIAEQDYRQSQFDDAVLALGVAEHYDPESLRLAQLKTQIEDARANRQIVIANYPAYRETSAQLRKSYLQLKEMDQTVVNALHRFDYTYDSANLTDAIHDAYELNLESARLTARLTSFRNLVESGASERTHRPPTSSNGSLLPLP